MSRSLEADPHSKPRLLLSQSGLSVGVMRLCDTERRERFSRFQQPLDLVSPIVWDQSLLQQLGDDSTRLPFVLVSHRFMCHVSIHRAGTDEYIIINQYKSNYDSEEQNIRSARQMDSAGRKKGSGVGPEVKFRGTSVPLTYGDALPKSQTGRTININSTTRNPCLITDGGRVSPGADLAHVEGGTTVADVLDDNGVGQNNDYEGEAYGGSEAALDTIETYVAEYVVDERIASSGSIANTVEDVRTQEIGKTLGAHLRGDTPDDFLVDVAVSKWRDTSPVKWVFERQTGEADQRRSRTLQKPALVQEISNAAGAEGARYEMVERGGVRWEVAHTTIDWMHDVLAAVCEQVDHQPTAVQEDTELDRREWIDQLTQAGTTDVLERALGIEAPGDRDDWNKATLRAIHDVVVAGRDPSEVGR